MSWKFLMPVFVLVSCAGDATETTIDTNENEVAVTSAEVLTPVDFNNEVSFMQDGILSQIDALFQSDSSNIDVNFENTIFEIDLNIESLNAMKIPAGGDSLKVAMLEFMNFYKIELNGEFQTIIPLLKKPEWTKAEEKQVQDYDLKFANEEKVMFDKVISEQEKFAKANRIELQEL
ncbi:MAG: hypothetical protein IPO32_13575 [Crocinitomicaceae bacterium]|nr:hypothetical protein [Crocinitomicaceae bacterium]MBK9592471.1 hypothetical protein [Crocinitomicaceae bacterium]